MKVFKESMIRSDEDLKAIKDEVSIMRYFFFPIKPTVQPLISNRSRIYHPNVVLFMGACAVPGKSLMIGVFIQNIQFPFKFIHNEIIF